MVNVSFKYIQELCNHRTPKKNYITECEKEQNLSCPVNIFLVKGMERGEQVKQHRNEVVALSYESVDVLYISI